MSLINSHAGSTLRFRMWQNIYLQIKINIFHERQTEHDFIKKNHKFDTVKS